MFGFQINPGDRNPSRFATQFQALGKLHSCEINSWPDCQLASITCNTAVYPLPWIIHFYPVVRIGCKVRRRHRQRGGRGGNFNEMYRCYFRWFRESTHRRKVFLRLCEEHLLGNRGGQGNLPEKYEEKKRLEITCTYDIEKKKKRYWQLGKIKFWLALIAILRFSGVCSFIAS